jgi:hypothetical protein
MLFHQHMDTEFDATSPTVGLAEWEDGWCLPTRYVQISYILDTTRHKRLFESASGPGITIRRWAPSHQVIYSFYCFVSHFKVLFSPRPTYYVNSAVSICISDVFFCSFVIFCSVCEVVRLHSCCDKFSFCFCSGALLLSYLLTLLTSLASYAVNNLLH